MKHLYLTVLIAMLLTVITLPNCNQADEDAMQKIDSLMLVVSDFKQIENQNQDKIREYEQQILERGQKIDQLQSGIDSLKRISRAVMLNENQVRKLRQSEEEIEKLQAENQELTKKMDELNDQNKLLEKQALDESNMLADTLKLLVEKRNEISDCQKLVEEARKIKISHISQKVYYKGLFKKAKNIGLIEFSVLVHENHTATKGKKNIKLQVVQPNGEILGVEPGISRKEDGEIITNYTSGEFEFTGERLLLNLDWQRNETVLVPGDYTIRYFIDGYQAGEGKLELKK